MALPKLLVQSQKVSGRRQKHEVGDNFKRGPREGSKGEEIRGLILVPKKNV